MLSQSIDYNKLFAYNELIGDTWYDIVMDLEDWMTLSNYSGSFTIMFLAAVNRNSTQSMNSVIEGLQQRVKRTRQEVQNVTQMTEETRRMTHEIGRLREEESQRLTYEDQRSREEERQWLTDEIRRRVKAPGLAQGLPARPQSSAGPNVLDQVKKRKRLERRTV